MKKASLFFIIVFGVVLGVRGQADSVAAKAKSDAEAEKKAAGWIASLQLNDPAKETRLTAPMLRPKSPRKDRRLSRKLP